MGPPRPHLQTYPTARAMGRASDLFRKKRDFLRFDVRNLCSWDRLVRQLTRARMMRRRRKPQTEIRVMLGWVVTFLIIALIAGVLGFGGIAGASIEIAKIIFVIAVVLFLVSAVVGLARGRTRV